MKKVLVNIDEIEETILAYANGDFTKRLAISDRLDERDIIAAGINMLGEELEEKSVSKDYFFKILNSIPQVVVVFDRSGRVDLINETAYSYLKKGTKSEEISSIKGFPDAIFREIDFFLTSKKTSASFKVKLELSKNRAESTYLLCTLSSINKVRDGHFLFVAKDITNEKSEEKNIIRATIHGQEKERKRLAYELHDALGQELNAIKMYMNAMEYMDITSTQFKKSLIEVHKMLNDSIESVRNISYNLTPSTLEKGGLKLSLHTLVNKISSLNKVHINLNITSKELKFKNKTEELFIYRVFQEFINNTLRFAEAKNLNLSIKWNAREKKSIYFMEDDGKGFNWLTLENKNGLTNMFNRLSSLNITYKFNSEPKKGTSLYFEIYDRR